MPRTINGETAANQQPATVVPKRVPPPRKAKQNRNTSSTTGTSSTLRIAPEAVRSSRNAIKAGGRSDPTTQSRKQPKKPNPTKAAVTSRGYTPAKVPMGGRSRSAVAQKKPTPATKPSGTTKKRTSKPGGNVQKMQHDGPPVVLAHPARKSGTKATDTENSRYQTKKEESRNKDPEENIGSHGCAVEAEAVAAFSPTKSPNQSHWLHKRAVSYYVSLQNMYQESALRSTVEASDWEEVDDTTPQEL